jgi:hypothetical protein
MLLASGFTMPLFPDRNIEGGEGMALRELQAMQVAYEMLAPLDPRAQQRAMAWLSAALADKNGAPTAVEEPAAPAKPVAAVVQESEPVDSAAEAEAMAEHASAVPDVETAAPAASAVEPVAAAEPEVAVEPEPVTEPTPAPRPRRGGPAKPTGRRAAKTAKSAAAVTPAQAVPGRRGERPSGEQFRADLADAGSFKALAEKYGKSIGTIGNWANQLREQGFDIPVGRQKKA